MEAHGGDIGVYSDGQAGSTFFVDIPIVEGRTSLPTISSHLEDGGLTERSEAAGVSSMGLNNNGGSDYVEEGYGNIFDIEKPSSVFATPSASLKASIPLPPDEMSYSTKSRRHSSVSFSVKHGGMYSNIEAVKALTVSPHQASHGDSSKAFFKETLISNSATASHSADTEHTDKTTNKLPAINAYPSPSPRARSQSMYSMTSPRTDADPIEFVNHDDMPMRSKSQPKEAPVHHAYSFNDVKALSQTRQASHSALPKPHWSSVLLVDDCVGIRKITTRSLASSVQIDDFEEVRFL